MYKKFLLAALTFASFQAYAADANYVGGYVGAGVGQSKYKFDGFPAGSSGNVKDTDTSYKIFGGYQFHKNFATELSYTNLGTAKITVVTPAAANADVKADSTALSLIGLVPLNDSFTLFGKVGYAHTTASGKATVGGITINLGKEKQNEALYGIGGQYNFNKNVGLRLEWETLDRSKVDNAALSVVFKFK